jgi:diguanylate cyclase (GGDEF)-like protein/PAS domain S-box-containing protein
LAHWNICQGRRARMTESVKKKYTSAETKRLKNRIEELETAVIECKLSEDALKRSEKNLLSIISSLEDLIFIIGADGTFHKYYQSPDRKDLFAHPKNFLGKHFKEVLPRDVADQFQNAIYRVEDYGNIQQFDFLMTVNRIEMWFNARISPLKLKTQDYFGYVVVLQNITDQKQREEALTDNEERYKAVMLQSTESIFLADVETRVILEANQSLQRLLGYSLEEIPGLSLYDFVANGQNDIYRKILRILKDRSYYKGEMQYRRKDGTLVDVEINVNLVSYRGKKVFCVISRDITPRKLAEKQLIHTATHDPLTGLTNRLVFYDRIAVELARARRNQTNLALIYIDLDRFKIINDTLGHSCGDQLLRAVAERLQNLLRETDTLARMGGDEFMYILPEVENSEDVDRIAEKVLDAIRKPYLLDGQLQSITASIGTAIYPSDGKDAETLMKNADFAMYFAKDNGRDKHLHFTSEMSIKNL